MNMQSESERLKNQQEFRAILAKHKVTQSHSATLITMETYRVVKPRTVRAWLANKNAKTAAPCPIWAVIALKKALKKTK